MPRHTDSGEVPECRICRDSSPPLVQPCRCSSFIHISCLRRWVAARADSLLPLAFSLSPPSCEVCLAPYESTPKFCESDTSPSSNRQLSSLFSGIMLCAPDPLELQPRLLVCEYVLSLECCVLVCLLMLAIFGHTVFLVHMYGRSTAYDDFAKERRLLACANAILTGGLLFLIQRTVSKWLRDESAAPVSSVGVNSNPHSGTQHAVSSADISRAFTDQRSAYSSRAAGSSGIEVFDEEHGSPELVSAVNGLHVDLSMRENTFRSLIGRIMLGSFLTVATGAEVYLVISAM